MGSKCLLCVPCRIALYYSTPSGPRQAEVEGTLFTGTLDQIIVCFQQLQKGWETVSSGLGAGRILVVVPERPSCSDFLMLAALTLSALH
jgi:hypothetical protein